jgi:hypothetical protein
MGRRKDNMAIVITFLLGIANFTLHRAVLESGHAMVRAMTGKGSLFTPRVTLAIEFGLLLISLLLVANGTEGWAWAYAFYTLANGVAAWLIVTRRI